MESIYPELLQEYLDFCKLREQAINSKILDLSGLTWIYPTKLLPLVTFLKNNPAIKPTYPKAYDVQTYFTTITQEKTHLQKKQTYLPLVTLPLERKQATMIVERLQHLCDNGKNLGGIQVFGYFLGEMVDNVYDHSQFHHAYVFAQTYPKKKFSEIALIDDGISIRGSYAKAGHAFTDVEALLKAMEGLSAKDQERGFGLRTNVRLFTEGLKGEFLIVSGNAALYVLKGEKKVFKLQNEQAYQGTFISVRLPYPAHEVNIYDFIS
ncbi:MAG: hypothetical protein AABW64_00045 [Nanoarchaeota archaeon]